MFMYTNSLGTERGADNKAYKTVVRISNAMLNEPQMG